MKKILFIVLISSFIITACSPNKISNEDYKAEAIEITWRDLSQGDIKAMTTVRFSGLVKEINEKTGTLTVDQEDDNLFFVKNLEEANVKVNDQIEVWGIYAGYNRGLPLIDSKVIEKK